METIKQIKNTQTEQSNQVPELTIHDYWLIITRGKYWLILSILAALSFAFYYNYSVTPAFTSRTTLLINKDSDSGTMFEIEMMMKQPDINNQIEILKSRQVAMKAVETLWNSQHRNNLALFGTRKFEPRGQRPRRFIREVFTLGLYDPKSDIPNHFYEDYSKEIGKRFAGRIRQGIRVNNKRMTDILALSYTSPFPDESVLVANTVAEEYVKLDRGWGADQTLNLLAFLEDQLQLKGKELNSAEEKIKTFMEEEMIFDLSGNADALMKKSTDVEGKYYEAIAKININKENIRYIQQQLSKEEKQLSEQLLSSINTKVFALRQEISSLEAELIRYEGLYGPVHDAVLSAKKKIITLKEQLDRETKTLISRGLKVADPIKYRNELISQLIKSEATLSDYMARSIEYSKLMERYNIQIEALPKKQMDFARLERDRSVLSETYMFLRQKLEETRVNVASESGNIKIIDRALGSFLSSPDKNRNMILSLLFGICMGFGIIFLREFLDRTIQSIEWIERFGISVLGVIPIVEGFNNPGKRFKIGKHNKTQSLKEKRHLITREDPKSPISESYRTLRTNILYSLADNEVKSILVSSPSPGEGKTTTVSNLAITFANMGKRTLLLDADLRRPVIHNLFGLSKEIGLSHYLAGKEDNFDKLIQETDVENLYAVTAGIIPPNPSELLGSNKMKNLINQLKSKWDIILLDSPPLVSVTDATTVSQAVDVVVMVVKAAETDRDAFIRAFKSLSRLNIDLTGVVVNGISRRTSKDTYYYYYQYYQHYYGGYYGHDGMDEKEK